MNLLLLSELFLLAASILFYVFLSFTKKSLISNNLNSRKYFKINLITFLQAFSILIIAVLLFIFINALFFQMSGLNDNFDFKKIDNPKINFNNQVR